ncbi:hypothetical protein PAPYR_2379 [Paratrimastix pyriformis]|uniref:Uncharacterized protein n=1 Tax=Paratrimastix pyriformis TaxID=342808 RepID=A0ABQ8USL3_9EUKA|nr:hypothetical protein PAPYR_2379 [Paratrimastix pyriformis]
MLIVLFSVLALASAAGFDKFFAGSGVGYGSMCAPKTSNNFCDFPCDFGCSTPSSCGSEFECDKNEKFDACVDLNDLCKAGRSCESEKANECNGAFGFGGSLKGSVSGGCANKNKCSDKTSIKLDDVCIHKIDGGCETTHEDETSNCFGASADITAQACGGYKVGDKTTDKKAANCMSARSLQGAASVACGRGRSGRCRNWCE